MHVRQVIKQLGLNLTSGNQIDVEITGGYASDLLSCVMAGAKPATSGSRCRPIPTSLPWPL